MGVGSVPNPTWPVSLQKREIRTQTRTQGECHMHMKTVVMVVPKPRNTNDCQQRPQSQERGLEQVLYSP